MELKSILKVAFSFLRFPFTGINLIAVFFCLILIKLYQNFISPFINANCRFTPTCSAYAYQSLKQFGIVKGGYLSLKRILRCNPWGSFGMDSVPNKQIREKN